MNKDLLKAKQLSQEAKHLLEDLRILEILKQYCEPELIGSVPAELVVDLDIDISCFIKKDLDLSDYMDLAKKLVDIKEVKTLRIRDQRNNPNYSPFKLNIDELVYNDKKWNIAFSFILGTPSENDPNQVILRRLKETSDENKNLIVKLKKELLDAGGYKIPSIYIYEGVLANKVTCLDDLYNFIE